MNISETSNFWYIYSHTRLDTNEVFYIGIGKPQKGRQLYSRAFSTFGRSNFWKSIIKKTSYKIDIILTDLSWEEACLKEKELIKLYGRKNLGTGSLCNLTDGGDGNKGLIFTEIHKKRLKERAKGKSNIKGKKHKKSWYEKRCKKVINTSSNRIYISTVEASKEEGMPLATLYRWLTNKNTNKSNLKYYGSTKV